MAKTALELYRRYELLNDLMGSKISKYKDEIDYEIDKKAFEQDKTLVIARQQALQAEVDEAYGEFLSAMDGHESLDGVDRIRHDPFKKNSWQVKAKLTRAKIGKLPDGSVLQQAVQEYRELNESKVKQMLANGEIAKSGDHIVGPSNENLDDYISVEIKPDEFEETNSK
ncbi:hypothetical protein CNR30_01150 [Levilactobacillus brevis]|uniref:hypothetical protein n=1 Tax=Levilactobacillus brevis TaxID=1580 RepID=UPI0005A95FDB|nr:hypothetical protein [Levilactobacillus brevis]RDF15310.1 hypothetical protein CNR30_01150 [Levilactobacillus brevis]